VGLLFKGALIECGTPDAIKAHVPGQLIELQSDPLERAQAILTSHPDVIEVQVYGDLLHAFVDDAAQRIPQLAASLESADVRIRRIRIVPPRMEEAFISLIHKMQEAGSRRQEAR
jgi:ABC-2 type transport system ATP-binding protein